MEIKLTNTSSLLTQLDEGVISGVFLNIKDAPGYVAFKYANSKVEKYEDRTIPDYKIHNIKVFDTRTSKYLSFSIFVYSGLLGGYSIEVQKKYQIDVLNIDLSGIELVYLDDKENNEILSIFSEEERSLINPSELYVVHVEGKKYFHILDLEDGDFIGVDEEKQFYEIRHDPPIIVSLDSSLKEIMDC